jgi:hypothetical protein
VHVGLQTSYETVLKDSGVFTGIKDWATMIVDEAHRFKSISGATRRVVTSMEVRWKLLLTGARTALPLLVGLTVVASAECDFGKDQLCA